MRARAVALAAVALALAAPSTAGAAGAPQLLESFVTDVTATSASLRARVNPNGLSSTYRFEYVSQAAFEASGFATATKAPPSGAAPLGSGTTALKVVQSIGSLAPLTSYRYRAVATNSAGTTTSPEHVLTTEDASNSFSLPDGRAWELVSPVDKAGGAIAAPGQLFGGGDLQAAAAEAAITYGSATAFEGASGAPPASQYLSTRTAQGWRTESVSLPLESGAFGDSPDGAPFRLFSGDLSRALVLEGSRCAVEGSCPPAYVLWEGGALTALPQLAGLRFEGASPDLAHLYFSAPTGLYEWSGGPLTQLSATAGAELAAPAGAISQDGSRAYFSAAGSLYLRQGAETVQMDGSLGGGGGFQAASADGAIAFFTKAGHLYAFEASDKSVSDLTPSGGVVGVLGASADGSSVYYQDATGIQRWREGTTTLVVAGAQAAAASDYEPPGAGTARVSADGQHLAFLSREELTEYDNADAANPAQRDAELYLYGPPAGGGAPRLVCASCNPTGERPQGAASIPGAVANGSLSAYRPRALSADGSRLFFDSGDDLLPQDTNDRTDVYQWEAEGAGGCTRSPGCVGLISSGRSVEGASFVDAGADGSDAYFLTDGSLVASDPGSIDLYDARVGGGFAESPVPIACVADACQPLPSPPEDPDPGTLTPHGANPPPVYLGEKRKHKRKKHHHHHHHHHGHRGGERSR